MSSKELHTEKELLLRVAAGDEAAFKQVFNTWYPLLSTLVLRITRSEVLAEEVVQDVFVKIWMGREALEHVERFRPYLWVMAKHLAIDALRKTAARAAREKRYAEENNAAESLASDSPDYHTLIDEAIAKLPPQQQRVYLLSRRDKLKQAEIAQLMGISVTTVKSYMQLSVESITKYVKDQAGLGVAVVTVLMAFS